MLRGSRIQARAELVADPDDIDRLLAVIATRNPTVKRFVPIPRQPDGRLERAPLQLAIQHGFRIVRWHPAN